MGIPLRVLALEDAEADYLLLLRELKRGGLEPDSVRVQTAVDLKAALADRAWDIVISDYSMPQFTALDALKIVQESGLDLPFIVVSGTIGEEVAVEAMRSGAHDYLMKGKLLRLVPAVQRELHEAQVRREKKGAELALQKAKDYAENLILIANALVVGLDIKGRVRTFNPAAEKITGYTRAELEGRDWFEVVVPRRRYPQAEEEFLRILEGGLPKYSESPLLTKSGEERFIAWSNSALPEQDRFIGRISFGIDITQRKRDEEEIRQLNRLYDVLSEVNQALIRVQSREQFLQDICRIACETGGFKWAWIGWRQDPNSPRVTPVAWDGEPPEDGPPMSRPAEESADQPDPAVIAVREGKPAIGDDPSASPRTLPPAGSAGETGTRAVAAFPFRQGGKVCGVLCLDAGGTNVFQEKEIALLEEVALDISFGLDRLESEAQRRQVEHALKESEERLRLALRASDQGSFDLDLTSGAATVSPEYETMLGYEPGELHLTLDRWLDAVHPDDFPPTSALLQTCLRGEAPGYQTEFRLRSKAGEWKWILAMAKVFGHDAQGRPAHIIGTHRDITRSKQAEQELQLRNILLATQQETSLDGILVVDEHGHMLSWNRRFLEMWNVPSEVMASRSEEASLQSARKLLLEPDQFLEKVAWLYQHMGERSQDEIALNDGRSLERYSAPMIGPDGNSFGRVWYYRDVTERIRAEEAIRESEEKFRTLFESSRDAIMMVEQERFTDCNQATLELFGCSSKEDFISKHPSEVSPPIQADGSDSFATAHARMQTAFAQGSLFFPWIHQRKDGTPFPAEVLLSRYYLHGEAKLQAVVRDITESEKVKQELLKAAEEWRTTFDTIPDPIMITDLDHRILRANRALAQMVGRPFSEIVGKRFYQVVDAQDQWPAYYPRPEAVAERKDHTVEIYHPVLARSFLITVTPLLDHTGSLAGWVHLVRDITERKQMEVQTMETEKLASLGVMAGGVAHEINNPIGGILGIAQLLLMDYPDRGALTEDLKNIEGAALHCSEIVKNLLAFSHRTGTGLREPVEIPELLNQIMKLIGHQFIYYNIEVRQEFGPDFPGLLLNRTQFQQVLINLLINAQQAMTKKGEVVVRGLTLPSREAVIEIEDQGCGIPAAIRDRIFDPFFTTKEQGKGTGLGLSVSYRILKEHGGRIEVESEEGKGTRMRLVLPPELITT